MSKYIKHDETAWPSVELPEVRMQMHKVSGWQTAQGQKVALKGVSTLSLRPRTYATLQSDPSKQRTLHMLMHMPLQPLCSRYLHFLICTPLLHVCFCPLNSTSASWTSKGPTSQAKNFCVIAAFSSAVHCSTRAIVQTCCPRCQLA